MAAEHKSKIQVRNCSGRAEELCHTGTPVLPDDGRMGVSLVLVLTLLVSKKMLGPPNRQSCSSEKKALFGAVWKMSRIFCELFCSPFPLKLKDENLKIYLPKFRRIFRRSLTKISQEFRSGGSQAQQKDDRKGGRSGTFAISCDMEPLSLGNCWHLVGVKTFKTKQSSVFTKVWPSKVFDLLSSAA